LSERVHTHLGIAGGNRGLTACYLNGELSCNERTGFDPGALVGGSIVGRSLLIEDLLAERKEADRTVSMWSATDSVIGFGGLVWGEYTSQIPGADDEIRDDDLDHLELRDAAEMQLQVLTL
jgi:hypothetical protein